MILHQSSRGNHPVLEDCLCWLDFAGMVTSFPGLDLVEMAFDLETSSDPLFDHDFYSDDQTDLAFSELCPSDLEFVT